MKFASQTFENKVRNREDHLIVIFTDEMKDSDSKNLACGINTILDYN